MSYNCSGTTRSLYIHWPFCPYRCHFCPFIALASHDQFMERYHKVLIKEITEFAHKHDEKFQLDTIYFGGGTPSTYPDDLLLDMFGILKNTFVFNKTIEVTIEVNPGTVRKEQLPLWNQCGINRMSVGVQSLKDDVLQRLNRLQTAQDVYDLLVMAPEHIGNISVDVILGLPGVSAADWKSLLRILVTWPIKHVSMYILEIHDNTPLFFKVKTKSVMLPPDDEIVDLYYWSRDFLADHGLQQYEISSFSREDFESRHNTVYWERKPYKGFGLGACSFDGKRRFQNEKNLIKYMEGIEQGHDITMFSEMLTAEQVRLETIMLALRRQRGIHKNELMANLSPKEQEGLEKKIRDLQERRLVVEDNGRLQLSPAGLVVENEIITQLSL